MWLISKIFRTFDCKIITDVNFYMQLTQTSHTAQDF